MSYFEDRLKEVKAEAKAEADKHARKRAGRPPRYSNAYIAQLREMARKGMTAAEIMEVTKIKLPYLRKILSGKVRRVSADEWRKWRPTKAERLQKEKERHRR